VPFPSRVPVMPHLCVRTLTSHYRGRVLVPDSQTASSRALPEWRIPGRPAVIPLPDVSVAKTQGPGGSDDIRSVWEERICGDLARLADGDHQNFSPVFRGHPKGSNWFVKPRRGAEDFMSETRPGTM